LAKLQAKSLMPVHPVCLAVILLKDEELARYLTYNEQKLFLLLLCYYTDYF